MTETDSSVEPGWLLDHARWLVRQQTGATRGRWARASALLARQAVEIQVDRICGERDPGLAMCSERAQLLCLPLLVDEDLAHDVAFVWSALSRACHHHPYDISPTAGELESWFEVIERLLEARLAAQPTAG